MSTNSAPTLEMCRCGMSYLTTQGGARYCPNCDTIQVRQMSGLRRARTRNDVKYDAYWGNIMATEYPPLPPGADENWVDGTGD